MNFKRGILASFAAFVAYSVIGTLVFSLPVVRAEFLKYPAIYRSLAEMNGVMPIGMASLLITMFGLAWIYSLIDRKEASRREGLRFGFLVGVFSVGAFVAHNYVNLRIGPTLAVEQAIACFAQWAVAGTIIGFIYRSHHPQD